MLIFVNDICLEVNIHTKISDKIQSVINFVNNFLFSHFLYFLYKFANFILDVFLENIVKYCSTFNTRNFSSNGQNQVPYQ